MKTSKIVLAFSKLRDGGLEEKSLAIASAMAGNANFPDPAPTLAELNTAIKNFSDALAAAKTRDKVKVILKNDMRGELEAVLTNLSHYVTFIAKRERAILASSGFTLNSEISNSVTLGGIENFSVQLGENSGEAILSSNSVTNAKTYLYLYSPVPAVNNFWMHVISSLPYAVISGLDPGKEYSFKMGASGANEQVKYSETITKMVV